jgi:DNA-directed RNA polymerase specialized sigma24 family protein
MRRIEDATLAQIASESGSSVSAVSQRLRTAHRAVDRNLAS